MKIQVKLGLYMIGQGLISGSEKNQANPTHARCFDYTTRDRSHNDNSMIEQISGMTPRTFDNAKPAHWQEIEEKLKQKQSKSSILQEIEAKLKEEQSRPYLGKTPKIQIEPRDNAIKEITAKLCRDLELKLIATTSLPPSQLPSFSQREYQNHLEFLTSCGKQNNGMKYIIAGIIIGAFALAGWHYLHA